MTDFIYNYFIKPIITGEGYNPVNTVVYAIGFLAAMYLTKIVFNKLKVDIDENWFNGVFAIAFVGGIIRALEDWVVRNYGILPTHFLTVTPGIYIVLSAVVLAALWRDREHFPETIRRLNIRLILLLSFVVLAAILTTGIHNTIYVIIILISAGITGELVFQAMNRLGVAKPADRWLILGQALDGFATAIALAMVPGYFEQHVVTNALISKFGPFAYPIVKLTIAVVVVYLINTQMNDEREWSWILRLFITIIGLGPGTRDTLRLLMGV